MEWQPKSRDKAQNGLLQRFLNQLVEEQRRASLLRSHGLDPRHRVLLTGPPGNGKTSLAEAIAEALAIPLFVVRYDSMMGSYLGETASRLKKVFDVTPSSSPRPIIPSCWTGPSGDAFSSG